eukprot:101508_1
MASAGSKRKLDSLDNITNPPLKKQKVARAKLGKTDYELIKNGLKSGEFIVIKYDTDDVTTNYKFIECVVAQKNIQNIKCGRDLISKKPPLNITLLALSIGPTPLLFICPKCWIDDVLQLWKHNTSSRNFQTHRTSKHGLVLSRIQWSMPQRLQMLQPSLEYVAWDRNSFNSIGGPGLTSLLTAAFNLGCEMRTPVSTLEGLVFSGGCLSIKMRENGENIESERRSYYTDYFSDFANYPFNKHTETDMWKSLGGHDYINLIVRNYHQPTNHIIADWEDLEEFNNVVGLSMKYAEDTFKQQQQLDLEQMENCKTKLDELKAIEDAQKKKNDFKRKRKKNNKKKLNDSNKSNKNEVLHTFASDKAGLTDVTRDDLVDWFVPDKGDINWAVDHSDNEDDHEIKEVHDDSLLEVDEQELDEEFDEGFTTATDDEAEYKKTIKNISFALMFMLRRVGFGALFDLEAIEAEIKGVFADFEILKLWIHTDNAMANIDDWVWWLKQIFCFNHNLMLGM